MDVIVSRHQVPIRLPDERWVHVTEEYSELAGYYYEVLEAPQDSQAIFEGREGELLASREIEPGKHLVVVYREVSAEDGFLITAFLTRRLQVFQRRPQIWPP